MNIDWIDNRLAISGSIDDYNQLTKECIIAVINVKGESHDDINELTKRGISYFYIPIPDWMPPRKAQMDLFNRLLSKIKGKVLVHCELGIGRSGSLAISYLINSGKCKKLDDAFKYMRDIGHPVDGMWITQLEKLRKHYV